MQARTPAIDGVGQAPATTLEMFVTGKYRPSRFQELPPRPRTGLPYTPEENTDPRMTRYPARSARTASQETLPKVVFCPERSQHGTYGPAIGYKAGHV